MGTGRRFYSLRETLESFLGKNRELDYRIKTQEALTAWDGIVDDYVRGHAATVLVKDGILFVNTDSSTLANELAMRESEIREKLNMVLGEPVIRRIAFKSGFVKKVKRTNKINRINTKKLTLKTLNLIDDTVQTIQEDELRFIVRKLLISAAMRVGKGK